MGLEKQTWLRRTQEWFENHQIFGPLLLLVFLLGIVGGFISFTKEAVGIAKILLNRDANEITVAVELQNTRSDALTVDPLCDFELTEQVRNSTRTHRGIGEELRLLPLTGGYVTNRLRIEPRSVRACKVRFPNNQSTRELMDRGAAILRLHVFTDYGASVEGTIPFQRELLRREKAIVRF